MADHLAQSNKQNKISTLLTKPVFLILYASVCAFLVYTCMFGFRKPYTVGTYDNLLFFGKNYKVWLVIAQTLGYMCSKLYGIKFISGLQPSKRAFYIIIFVCIAWLSLALFAITPAPYNIFFMFINGLPLGMIFGLVFGFVEGRKSTEIIGAVLASSFIFGSGLAKTVGKMLHLNYNVTDWWTPFASGAIYFVPLCFFVFLLSKIPKPTTEDIAHRNERLPMTNYERKTFLKQYGKVIIPVVIAYTLFTIVRDFCEDFANELWIETGHQNDASIFANINTKISFFVLLIIGSFFIFKNNFKALIKTHYIVIGGLGLSFLATLLHQNNYINSIYWMLFASTGMYLAYIPFNCLFFERMISTYKIKGNIAFVMYIADTFGYLGTITVLLIKNFIPIKYSWVNFFSFLFYAAGIIGVLLLCVSLFSHYNLHNKIFKKNKLL